MEGTVGPRLLESLDRGIHRLSGSGKSACSQRLNLLGVADFSAGVDCFLSSFEKLLSELSKLEDLSFNEWIPESAHRTVDKLLVRLPILKYALPEWGEWRLGTVARSGS